VVVIALMVVAAAEVGAGLLVRPPRTIVGAAGYAAVSLTLLFILAPATRWGYFVYPLGIGCWLWLSRLVEPHRIWPAGWVSRPETAGPQGPVRR
jgi:hypothetical protein